MLHPTFSEPCDAWRYSPIGAYAQYPKGGLPGLPSPASGTHYMLSQLLLGHQCSGVRSGPPALHLQQCLLERRDDLAVLPPGVTLQKEGRVFERKEVYHSQLHNALTIEREPRQPGPERWLVILCYACCLIVLLCSPLECRAKEIRRPRRRSQSGTCSYGFLSKKGELIPGCAQRCTWGCRTGGP